MSSVKFSDLLQTAQQEGISTGSLLAAGNYDLRAAAVNVGETKAGKAKISIKWQVEGGPSAGETSWENLNVPTPSGQDEAAIKKYKTSVAIFIGRLKSLGITDDFLNQDPSLQDIADSLLGVYAEHQVGERNGWQTFKTLRLIEETPVATRTVSDPVPGFLNGSTQATEKFPTGFLGAN